jgi:hypothetical protein
MDPARGISWENGEKILFRGNELSYLLITQGLAVFGVQNELAFECKRTPIRVKKGAKTPPFAPY